MFLDFEFISFLLYSLIRNYGALAFLFLIPGNSNEYSLIFQMCIISFACCNFFYVI